ncbi:MAG: hypothetical protein ABSG65_32295 [Bryobacteraceae bacterium]|jgi:hypothetical protein
MSQRVVFTFDQNSLDTLNAVKKNGDFGSLGTAVRESLTLSEVLQGQAAQGFNEVVVRNPKTGQEKTLIIPSLQRVAGASA